VSKRRVVVTGMGMLTPVGNTVEASWKALLAGQSGIVNIEHFDTTEFTTRFAGLVKDFNAEEYMSKKDARKMDLFIQYGVAAGIQALDDSGFKVTEENAHRIGAAIGSGIGGLGLIEAGYKAFKEKGPRKISPFFVPSTIVNMISGHMSIMRGLRGPNIAISTACTTGLHNIGHAARMIAYGDADAMLAGGAEKASTELGMGGFGAAKALSTNNENPQGASRPWDKNRDGFVLGDGAGMMVLEEYEHAKARGATIYAELVGFASNCDAAHVTQPQMETMQLCMEMSLKDANLSPESIGYVSAHGTATERGDIAESTATENVFGSSMPISSLKSYFGHTLGACGAIEAWLSIEMMRNNWFSPTLNLNNVDERCGKLDYITGAGREIDCNYIMSNNFAFGGINTSLIFKRWTEV
jgi:3-oxoacyl-[acyl-carrier-protein] synthase II